MVSNISINDLESFNELGCIVNPHFKHLFNLQDILNSPSDYLIGYKKNDSLIAFLHITKSFETIDIVNLVVHPKFRQQHIATELLHHLEIKFNDIKTIFLEVNENNIPAIKLYQKNNFQQIQIRKNYYGEDNALIMKKDIKTKTN